MNEPLIATAGTRTAQQKAGPAVPSRAADQAKLGERRSQAERRAEAESRLIAAAGAILSRKGWAGTTLAEVGEAAGYSRGLAAHHFGDKAGLLRALVKYINSSMWSEMSAAPSRQPGLDAIVGYLGTYLSRRDPNWTNTRTLFHLAAEALRNTSELREFVMDHSRTMFEYLEENIRIGIEKDEIRKDIVPAFGAEFLIGTLRGIMLERLLNNEVGDTRQLRDQLTRMIKCAFAVQRR